MKNRYPLSPIDWGGKPVSDDEKRAILDGLKQEIGDALPAIAQDRLRNLPLDDGKEAYKPRLKGSTTVRRQRVRTILQMQIPVPEFVSDSVRIRSGWSKSKAGRGPGRKAEEGADNRLGAGKGMTAPGASRSIALILAPSSANSGRCGG